MCPLCHDSHSLSQCPSWKTMRFLVLIPAILLTGCSSSPKWLENRVACTADKSEAHVVSKWGLFGISAKIAEDDAKVICKRDQPT